MKKFVLKLILFSGLILGSLVLLNFLYVGTEAYRTMNDMEKFYNVPDNLEIVNFGSSHGLYGFDWSQEQVNGFNFSLVSQDFYYDLRLLEKFSGHLAEGTIVIIPISYFSFDTDRNDEEGDFQKMNGRYYSLLAPREIYDFELQDYIKNCLLPVLSAGRKLINIISDHQPENNLTKSINLYEFSQLPEKGRERAHQHLELINKTNHQENINYLKELIEYSQSKKFKPVLITTPTTEWYFRNFSDEFLLEFSSLVKAIAADYSIPYLDYSQDVSFRNKPELFLDTDHLNAIGRKIFTSRIIDDLSFYLKPNE